MSTKPWQEQSVLGIPILADAGADVAWVARQAMNSKQRPFVIVTPNPEQLVLAQENDQFAAALKAADMRVPDGAGVVWALGRQGIQVRRIPGVELVSSFIRQFPEKKFAILGGRDYGSDTVLVHDVTLAWNPGYSEVQQPTLAEEKAVKAWLHEVKPDILFMAFGAPAQEEWVRSHRQLLADLDVQVAMVVGGSFDILLGKLARAPHWIRAANLEWLFRLIQQPSRLGRQLKGAQFFWKV